MAAEGPDPCGGDLPTLIDVKSKVGRAKDKLAVADLIVILEERQRKT